MLNGWIVIAPLLAALVAGLSAPVRRRGWSTSVPLLAAGIALSFAGAHTPPLHPEAVLLLLLPPLLYSSGVGMSWRGFRSNLRPILLLAVGCVLFTTAAVAALAHRLFGWPLAVGFVLGAIVAPPDSVAPMAVLRRLGLPRRLVTVLEGESLVNDATALVAFSFALGAVATGAFSPAAAAGRFLLIVGGEIGWGVGVGWAMLRLRHLADDPRAEVLLALVTPFLAFWPPHELGGSGVIACVSTGLWTSWNGRALIRPATRLQGYFIWDLVTWSIEGLLFLLTGLQARGVAAAIGAARLGEAVEASLLVVVALIVVRFLWVFPATYLPRLIPAVRARDPFPNWRSPALVGFAGLRGAVSLAAALSVPETVAGRPFPERALIQFITFAVIVATLVGEGAILPLVARRLGLDRAGREEAAANRRDERRARIEGVEAVITAVDAPGPDAPPPKVAASLRHHNLARREHLARSADADTPDDPVGDWSLLQLRLLDVERRAIGRAYEQNRLTDEARRRIERELDLEEARVRNARESSGAESVVEE